MRAPSLQGLVWELGPGGSITQLPSHQRDVRKRMSELRGCTDTRLFKRLRELLVIQAARKLTGKPVGHLQIAIEARIALLEERGYKDPKNDIRALQRA